MFHGLTCQVVMRRNIFLTDLYRTDIQSGDRVIHIYTRCVVSAASCVCPHCSELAVICYHGHSWPSMCEVGIPHHSPGMQSDSNLDAPRIDTARKMSGCTQAMECSLVLFAHPWNVHQIWGVGTLECFYLSICWLSPSLPVGQHRLSAGRVSPSR